MHDTDKLVENLRALIGSHGRPQLARDPVNQAAIRNWCDAIGMDNPRYTDAPESAVAPKAMLCTWTLPGNIVVAEDATCPRVRAFHLLREHGYGEIIGTAYEEEYLRPLRLGEVLSGTLFLTDVSERKKTGLGDGYFLTTQTKYANQAGEPVGSWTFRMLVYQPRLPQAAAAEQSLPATNTDVLPAALAAAQRSSTRLFHEVMAGEELPPWSIPITSRLVIAGAVATRDFSDLHLDVAAARRVGARDLFLNALTSSGLCSRYAEAWAGPAVEQKNIRLRFGAPNVVGDCLTVSASVAAREAQGAHGVVTLKLLGRSSAGDHLSGTLDLQLPA